MTGKFDLSCITVCLELLVSIVTGRPGPCVSSLLQFSVAVVVMADPEAGEAGRDAKNVHRNAPQLSPTSHTSPATSHAGTPGSCRCVACFTGFGARCDA